AAGNLDEARALFQQAAGTGDPDAVAQALNGWAHLEHSAGNPEQARRLYRRLLDIEQPPAESGE
ncbi:tetratricopeptide repeat protein, partial [Nonomuraea thailandensis]